MSHAFKDHFVHLLADGETCPKKCRVEIHTPSGNMHLGYFYSLRRINVTFGDKSAMGIKCARSFYAEESSMLINCPSWRHGKNKREQVLEY